MRRSNLANRKILASNGSNLRETGRAFQLPLTTGLADDLPDVIGPKFGRSGQRLDLDELLLRAHCGHSTLGLPNGS